MTQRTSQIVFLLLGVAMFGATCHHREPEMLSIGPDVRYDLLIFFNTNATHDQIETFSNEVLSYSTRDGHWPRPGVGGILRVAAVQGHEAVAVSFFSSATDAERTDIKSRVRSSPIVYRVMENVVPMTVKRVD